MCVSIRSLFAALMTSLMFSTCAPATELYIAPTGKDDNPGTKRLPFVTIERARDEVRKLKEDGTLKRGVTVYIRAGLYELSQPFKLEAQDAGTEATPIVYRAYGNEKPVIIGGRAITGFTPYEGSILKADVAAQGFKGVNFRQLLFDGHRQHLARYPNYDPQNPYGGGWAYVDGAAVPMYKDLGADKRRLLQYKTADARNWARPTEGEVFIFPRYNWWNNIVRIASVDRDQRLITLAGNCSYDIYPGDRYYVRGLFEELDAPGEWYLDTQTWTLYFWPPQSSTGILPVKTGEQPATGKMPVPLNGVFAPTLRTLLEFGPGTAHVTFRGLTFEGCEGTAITLQNTTNCLIAACTIRNVGDYHGSGVDVQGGFRNGVVGCDIYEIGSHAISLSGGDQKTLTAAENYADNNYLHHFGVFYKQGVGIALRGVGNRASHNLIHDGPRFGIMFSGNNLVIEYNHIRHVNLETADTGAVYTGGRDWLGSRGTVIRYNFFHDILGYGRENGKWVSPHYCWGIYLDDNTGGVDVIGNIVARCVRGLIHLHNGRDNLIENNIFIDGTLQQMECNGWTATHSYWVNHLPTMIKGYESVANQPAWQQMRGMQTHPRDAVLPSGTIMSGNVYRRNIITYSDPNAKYTRFNNFPFEANQCDSNLIWHAGLPLLTSLPKVPPEDQWAEWQKRGCDVHSIIADPKFANPAKDDYRLRWNSPAYKLGFKPIPTHKIGPYRDNLRATWPIVEAKGVREQPINP